PDTMVKESSHRAAGAVRPLGPFLGITGKHAMRHRAIRLYGSIVCSGLLFTGMASAQPTLPEVEVEAPRVPATAPQVIPPGTFTPTFNPPSTPSAGEATTDRTLVGSYQQPAWTTDRPFASTRSYVLPAGQVEFEQ